MVSDENGRAAVVFGRVVRVVDPFLGTGAVARVGPRVDIGAGDAQLLELADGACSLVARLTKDDAYVLLPPSVTYVAAHMARNGVPLPERVRSEGSVNVYDFVVPSTERRFIVEHDLRADEARSRDNGDSVVGEAPCPRSALAKMVARRPR